MISIRRQGWTERVVAQCGKKLEGILGSIRHVVKTFRLGRCVCVCVCVSRLAREKNAFRPGKTVRSPSAAAWRTSANSRTLLRGKDHVEVGGRVNRK